jgi:hypothetical protein
VGTERRQRQKSNRAQRQVQLERQARRRSVTKRGVLIGGAVAVIFVVVLLVAISIGGGDDDGPSRVVVDSTVPTETSQAPAADGTVAALPATTET